MGLPWEWEREKGPQGHREEAAFAGLVEVILLLNELRSEPMAEQAAGNRKSLFTWIQLSNWEISGIVLEMI